MNDDDKTTWQEFLKDPNKYPEPQNKHTPIDDKTLQIDLHQMSLEEAYNIIINSLDFAKTHHIKTISIITGIGKRYHNNKEVFGKLYTQTPKWLDTLKVQNKIYKYYRNKSNPGEIIAIIFK